MNKNLMWAGGAVVAIAVAYFFWVQMQPVPQTVEQADNVVAYRCDDGKMISAEYISGTPESARLSLSDGRTMSLDQSAENPEHFTTADRSVIFLSRGEGGLVQEGQRVTYKNCVAIELPAAGEY